MATNAICRHFFRQRIKGIWRLPAALTDATFNHTKNKVASSVERLPPETTARKILPLLDLLAKFKRVLARLLAGPCSQNVCSCTHTRFLVSIAQNFVNPSLG